MQEEGSLDWEMVALTPLCEEAGDSGHCSSLMFRIALPASAAGWESRD